MIKEGDILFCLKDIEDIYYNGLLFKKNKSYKVCYSTSYFRTQIWHLWLFRVFIYNRKFCIFKRISEN